MAHSDKEKSWEATQIKGMTAWLNTYLAPHDLKIQNVQPDLGDGLRLPIFLEGYSKNKLSYTAKPTMKLHKINNLNVAIQYIQHNLNVKLVGISAEDIVDGNLKLTLGLLWSIYSKLEYGKIAASVGVAPATSAPSGGVVEDGLIIWARKVTHGYPNVKINKFNDSFGDGIALVAIVHKYNPAAFDFNSFNPANAEANLRWVIETAERHLNVPRIVEPHDLMGTPDDRTVALYLSFFWNAFETSGRNALLSGTPAPAPAPVSVHIPQPVAASAPHYLKLHYITDFEKLWDDSKTGAKPFDLSIFRPIAPPGAHILGHVGDQSHNASPNARPIAVEEIGTGPTSLLAAPIDYEEIWNDRGTGAKFGDCSIWKPIAPPGYVAIGYVITRHHGQKPSLDIVRCVHFSTTTEAKFSDTVLWSTKNTSTKFGHASLWSIVPKTGDTEAIPASTFCCVKGHDKPQFPVYLISRSFVH